MRIAILTRTRDLAGRLDRDLASLPHVRVSVYDEITSLIDWAKTEGPGLIVIVMNADNSEAALDRLNAVRRNIGERGPAILAMIPDNGPITAAETLTAGATDVCRLGAHPAEFRNRAQLLLTMAETDLALWVERDGSRRQSISDPLTGLMNRPAFMNRLDAEIARAKRNNEPLVVGLLEMDRLKEVNEKYGEAMGDRVLCALADHTSRMLREMDIAGRLGGSEFALCLPEVGLSAGATVLDRLRRRLSELAFPLPKGALSITISIGVTVLDPDDHDGTDLINRADRALLRAKDKGRGRLERL